jgi:hypothetical protein
MALFFSVYGAFGLALALYLMALELRLEGKLTVTHAALILAYCVIGWPLILWDRYR